MNRTFKLTLSAVALAAGLVGVAKADEWPPTNSMFLPLTPTENAGDATSPASANFSDSMPAQYFVEAISVFAPPTSGLYYWLELPTTPGIDVTGVSLTYYAQTATLLPLNVTMDATGTLAATPGTYDTSSFTFWVYGVAQPGAELSGTVFAGAVPVPEPGEWSLLMAGLLGTAAIVRARRRPN